MTCSGNFHVPGRNRRKRPNQKESNTSSLEASLFHSFIPVLPGQHLQCSGHAGGHSHECDNAFARSLRRFAALHELLAWFQAAAQVCLFSDSSCTVALHVVVVNLLHSSLPPAWRMTEPLRCRTSHRRSRACKWHCLGPWAPGPREPRGRLAHAMSVQGPARTFRTSKRLENLKRGLGS